jgi:hypothetical protein
LGHASSSRDATDGSIARLLPALLCPAIAMYAIFQGAQQVLIPLQVEGFDAAHKLSQLALITTECSVTSVLGLVIGGAVSDATRSR